MSLTEKVKLTLKSPNILSPSQQRAEESLINFYHGFVLLMGVSLEQMTFLHLAEQMVGRNRFQRWANALDGKPMMVEVGGCLGGFGNF